MKILGRVWIARVVTSPRPLELFVSNILGQYVRIGRTLPQVLLFDLMAISDKYGAEIKKRLESHKAHGIWGDSKYIYGKYILGNFILVYQVRNYLNLVFIPNLFNSLYVLIGYRQCYNISSENPCCYGW